MLNRNFPLAFSLGATGMRVSIYRTDTDTSHKARSENLSRLVSFKLFMI